MPTRSAIKGEDLRSHEWPSLRMGLGIGAAKDLAVGVVGAQVVGKRGIGQLRKALDASGVAQREHARLNGRFQVGGDAAVAIGKPGLPWRKRRSVCVWRTVSKADGCWERQRGEGRLVACRLDQVRIAGRSVVVRRRACIASCQIFFVPLVWHLKIGGTPHIAFCAVALLVILRRRHRLCRLAFRRFRCFLLWRHF